MCVSFTTTITTTTTTTATTTTTTAAAAAAVVVVVDHKYHKYAHTKTVNNKYNNIIDSL